jgi:hypothetical protein
MTDTIEVEVDGVVDDGPPRRAPAWGLPAAIAVVGVLALAVIVRVVAPGLTAGQAPVGEPASAPTSPTVPASQDARVVAARDALAAWGRFAATGDLAALDRPFDPDGPQYQQLANEAGTLRSASATAQPYEVTLTDAHLGEATPGKAVVTGTVAWTRPDEPDQRYAWELVLRSTDGKAWRLWTVRDLPSGAARELTR